MFDIFNKAATKVKSLWNKAFPKTIQGNHIDISKGCGVHALLGYLAIENKEEQKWDIYARLLIQSGGTAGLINSTKTLIGSAPDEQKARDYLDKVTPHLKRDASQLLSIIGYKDPAKAIPSLTNS